MKEKLFLMTEKSFKSTVNFYSNQQQIDSIANEKLVWYFNKVFNPQYPFKFDFVLKNTNNLSILLNKIDYKSANKSIFKNLEIKAMKRHHYKCSYIISNFRKFLSTARSNHYSVKQFIKTIDNTIIYESFNGKSFADSPRMLYFYLIEKLPEYNHVVVTDNERLTKKLAELNIESVKKNSKKYFELYAGSRVWIANTRLSPQIQKKANQLYIQTWHGTPLKKLANDQTVISIPDVTLEEYNYGFNKETSRWDYLLSPSEIATQRFKSAFNLKNEQILTLGYPRNDELIKFNNKEHIHQLKHKYNIPTDKKVILYAPTWRDNDRADIGHYNFKLKLDLDSFNNQLGNEYILVIRAHYLVSEYLNLDIYENIYDLSKANDVNELFLMSDILITDYSSVYFDYANLQRPILFFAYDKEEYANDIRGFYVPYEKELPGPIFKTNNDLISYIKNKSYEGIPHSDKYKLFTQKYNYLDDGKATSRVGENIINTLIKEKEFQ
ncbi:MULTISPECIES: CDP-glycerol glycerophosphotransferase family protein [unclassified Mammaliicoccus]|uniref:CDP-glycerol glycerophosphotransferase family protein n=2 Tax=Mammaliicoccus TaxID=2803850 RepID=UPI001EFBF82A|nr:MULTISPECIES: CDP-glycerol glycerophosphotransferase family protein [unclassified Mammaliicoccus]